MSLLAFELHHSSIHRMHIRSLRFQINMGLKSAVKSVLPFSRITNENVTKIVLRLTHLANTTTVRYRVLEFVGFSQPDCSINSICLSTRCFQNWLHNCLGFVDLFRYPGFTVSQTRHNLLTGIMITRTDKTKMPKIPSKKKRTQV